MNLILHLRFTDVSYTEALLKPTVEATVYDPSRMTRLLKLSTCKMQTLDCQIVRGLLAWLLLIPANKKGVKLTLALSLVKILLLIHVQDLCTGLMYRSGLHFVNIISVRNWSSGTIWSRVRVGSLLMMTLNSTTLLYCEKCKRLNI